MKYDYKNHYTMKKHRLIRLEQENNRCEICGKNGTYVHHKDKSKDNHSLDNLMVVCAKCHFSLHSGQMGAPRNTPKIWGDSRSNLYHKMWYQHNREYILKESKDKKYCVYDKKTGKLWIKLPINLSLKIKLLAKLRGCKPESIIQDAILATLVIDNASIV